MGLWLTRDLLVCVWVDKGLTRDILVCVRVDKGWTGIYCINWDILVDGIYWSVCGLTKGWRGANYGPPLPAAVRTVWSNSRLTANIRLWFVTSLISMTKWGGIGMIWARMNQEKRKWKYWENVEKRESKRDEMLRNMRVDIVAPPRSKLIPPRYPPFVFRLSRWGRCLGNHDKFSFSRNQ